MHKNKKLFVILIFVCLIMFAFSFALVPFYNTICRIFGITGKTNVVGEKNTAQIDRSRQISIDFIANTNSKLPWTFYPITKKINIYPGETEKVFYYAKNNSDHTITAQAVPSVTPGIASNYFKKIECFCFRKQTLLANQAIKMPVIFYIDPALPKKIHEITLSYTLYPTDSK